jgi:hypothetical protein
VFVLNSNLNDVLPDDEDQIPPNGNPHPVNVQPKNNDHNPSNFEDVCDMDHVHQENVNYGWEVPPPPDEEMDWGPWEQQNEENVGDNEIVAVNYLTNVVVAMAAANSFLQHPDQPQNSLSVSSEAGTFFRAQGFPITSELPLPCTASSGSRSLAVASQTMNFDIDYLIREMANKMGLHQGIGPAPSVKTFLQDLAQRAQEVRAMLCMKDPVPYLSSIFRSSHSLCRCWLLNMDNLS